MTPGAKIRSVLSRLWRAGVLVVAAVAAMPGTASTQTFPSRPISLITPFAAGGPADAVARVIGKHMQVTLGQPVIIESVAGAAGRIGVGRVAQAAPDGYTLNIGPGSSTHVLNGVLYTLNYDVVKDFEPVALLTTTPSLIVVKKSLAANDLREFIAWLKANPDKLLQGTSGLGSSGHVTGMKFQQETGTRFQFIPYRGLAQAMQDLLAGQVDMMIDAPANSLPQVKAGTIKALAVTAKTRLTSAPDIPTVDEAGLPGFYSSGWYSIFAPKGTPRDVVARLNAAVIAALADPEVRKGLAELGQEVFPSEQQTPEALAEYQKAEIEKWWPIIRAANITLE